MFVLFAMLARYRLETIGQILLPLYVNIVQTNSANRSYTVL